VLQYTNRGNQTASKSGLEDEDLKRNRIIVSDP